MKKTILNLFGENGKELPKELHTYAIGSVTKTFTGSLIAKQVESGKLQLDSTIGNYLTLEELIYVPTIKQLVTHTSGLADEWEDALESNPDIAFSREQMVELFEETKNLIALHNIEESNLLKTLKLGGFPMPSIAVTKDSMIYFR